MIYQILLLFVFILSNSVKIIKSVEICQGKLCGMKVGYYVRENNQTYLYLGNNKANNDNNNICLSIWGVKEIFCSNLSSGWINIPLMLGGVIDVSYVDKSIQILNLKNQNNLLHYYYFIQVVEKLPKTFAYVDIKHHPYGTITWVPDYISLVFEHNDILISEGNSIQLKFIGTKDITLNSSITDIQISLADDKIEPGSWFLKSYLKSNNLINDDTSDQISFVHEGYVEYVLSPNDIKKHRRYVQSLSSSLELSYDRNNSMNNNLNQNKINICVWGGDGMDGQKSIWLQQMTYLNHTKFQFKYILSLGAQNIEDEVLNLDVENQSIDNSEYIYGRLNGQIIKILRNGMAVNVGKIEHARMYRSPLDNIFLNPSTFSELPSNGDPPLSNSWDGTASSCVSYILYRLKVANNKIENVSPNWCRNYLTQLINDISNLGCDLTVYGNNRGYNDDALLVAFSRILGIPTIAELLNLFVEILPDVIIGPSHYSVEHPSVLKAVENNSSIAVVISPGVDLNLFKKTSSILSTNLNQKTIKIGFIARLSIEKNIGLFIQAAYSILKECGYCRFVIIGDGLLRQSLEDLCHRLDIKWAVTFLGWQSSELLPSILSNIDIVVNPSLRAWSETFCISNIEVMALKIPLITFAIGGIGEYIKMPLQKSESNNDLLYSIGPNAIILNEASPIAITEAVIKLVYNSTLRQSIGEAGYNTIASYFSREIQIQKYEKLYSIIYEKTH